MCDSYSAINQDVLASCDIKEMLVMNIFLGLISYSMFKDSLSDQTNRIMSSEVHTHTAIKTQRDVLAPPEGTDDNLVSDREDSGLKGEM